MGIFKTNLRFRSWICLLQLQKVKMHHKSMLLCCCYGCINCKNNNIQERVDVNEIFNDDDDFGEYQDEDTNGEADNSSDSSKGEFFDDDEIDNT